MMFGRAVERGGTAEQGPTGVAVRTARHLECYRSRVAGKQTLAQAEVFCRGPMLADGMAAN